MRMHYSSKTIMVSLVISLAVLIAVDPVIGVQTSSRNMPSTGTINYPTNVVFKETCDTWNSKWGYYGQPPTVSDGTWVFDFSTSTFIQADYGSFTGYGDYKFRLRTTGPRPDNVDYWFFLYYAPDGDRQPSTNELDFIEAYGGRAFPCEFSLSLLRNGTGYADVLGQEWKTYWYSSWEPWPFPRVNWEDGNWHQVDFNYTASSLRYTIDGVVVFDLAQAYKGAGSPASVLPLPPMRLVLGGSGHGDFSLIIDEIEYDK